MQRLSTNKNNYNFEMFGVVTPKAVQSGAIVSKRKKNPTPEKAVGFFAFGVNT